MIQFPGCQLAETYESWPAGVSTLYLEPKIDGYRLSVLIQDGVCTYHCRKAEECSWAENVQHIGAELLERGFDNCIVDGEVFAKNWNQLSHLVRRKRAKMSDAEKAEVAKSVCFVAFDWLAIREGLLDCARPYHERRAQLVHTLAPGAPFHRVSLVVQYRVSSEAEAMSQYDELLEMGFEGGMLKDPNAFYKCKRSKAWLKLKPFETVEWTIVGAEEGEGKHKGKLGAFLCKTPEGKDAGVGGGFTDAEREMYWANLPRYIGAEIEVRKQVSDVSIARHANCTRKPIRIREEKLAPV